MMSAHEIAVAALNEVAGAVSRPEDGATSPAFAAAGSMDGAINTAPAKSNNDTLMGSQISSAAVASGSSQSTVPDGDTPPSSNFSSQSHDQGFQTHGSQVLDVAHSVPLARSNEAGAPPLTVATNAGQKRTIDGYVRRSSGSSSSESPALGYKGRHSRNTSAVSAASSAMSPRELTSELRTRLSYAMVKVNKGWESLPIYEVESLASQNGSPTSSSSTINGHQNVLASPRAAIASRQGLSGAPLQSGPISTIPLERQESGSFTDGQPSSRTYASFWREQSQRQIVSLSSPSSSQISLQPSAELSSTSRPAPYYRRSPPKSSKSKLLQAPTSSDLSQSSLSSSGVAPSTPGQDTRASRGADSVLQTPTQKSLQEQDAIETLLFMRSPGNPLIGTFSSAQSQGSRMQSPLKTDFAAEMAEEGRSKESSMTPRAYGAGPTRHRGKRGVTGLRRPGEDELDRMLDTMADESSDDEIELPTTPMRVAMGRV